MPSMNKKWKWMFCFAIVMLMHVFLLYVFHEYPVKEGTWLYPFVNNYGGNLSANILGGFLFLFLALYIQTDTDSKINWIFNVTEQRMRTLEGEAIIAQFERFAQKESYCDVRFVNEDGSLGLEYTIIPIRDPKTKKPLMKTVEADESYVIKLVLPHGFDCMSHKERDKYKTSDLPINTYYFCQFYNGSWHMGTESIPINWRRFYLSGKVGPVQWGQSANEYMSTYEDPIDGKKKLATLHLKEDGLPLVGCGGCTPYNIYQDNDDNLFLQIHDSLLKKMYYTNPKDIYTDDGWFFVIEDMWGYAHGQKLENILHTIQQILSKLNILPKKIPGYKVKEQDFSLFE